MKASKTAIIHNVEAEQAGDVARVRKTIPFAHFFAHINQLNVVVLCVSSVAKEMQREITARKSTGTDVGAHV